MTDGQQEAQQLYPQQPIQPLHKTVTSLILLFHFNCKHWLAVHLVRVDTVWQVYQVLSLGGKQHPVRPSQVTYACTSV